MSPEDQGYSFGGSRWEAQPYSGRLICRVRSQARWGRGSNSPLPAEDLRFSEVNAFLLGPHFTEEKQGHAYTIVHSVLLRSLDGPVSSDLSCAHPVPAAGRGVLGLRGRNRMDTEVEPCLPGKRGPFRDRSRCLLTPGGSQSWSDSPWRLDGCGT